MNNNNKIKNLNKRLDDLQKKVSNLPTKIPRPVSGTNRIAPSNTSKRVNSIPASSIPTWKSTGRGIRISQNERVATILSGSNNNEFSCQKFVVNPANNTTFPWLAGIASLFDKYKFHKLRFTFSNNAGTSTAGQVSLGFDFDTLDDPPIDGVGMSNLTKASQFAPWKTESLDVPVNRRGNNTWLYCEDLNAEMNEVTDLKTYNLGSLFVSTEGMAANTVAGYLHVEYDVELIDKNPRGSNDNILTRSAILTSGKYKNYSGSGSATDVVLDNVSQNTIGPAFTLTSRSITSSSLGMDITVPRGKYTLTAFVTVVFVHPSSNYELAVPELYYVSSTSQYLEKFEIVEGTNITLGSEVGGTIASTAFAKTYTAQYDVEFSANGSITLVASSVNDQGTAVNPQGLIATLNFVKKRETL